MLSLIVPKVRPTISLAGTIRFLAYPEVTGKWAALSGNLISVFDNPIIYELFGFRYGQGDIDGKIMLRLPEWNKTASNPVAVYPRAHNTTNSNGRNLNRSLLEVIPSALKAHNHPGYTSSAGGHTHSPSAAGRFSTGVWGVNSAGGGQYPADWTSNIIDVAHDSHAHSGGRSGPMIMPAEYTSTEVEPPGYGVILCIHLG